MVVTAPLDVLFIRCLYVVRVAEPTNPACTQGFRRRAVVRMEKEEAPRSTGLRTQAEAQD
jgi:hypothetical protein